MHSFVDNYAQFLNKAMLGSHSRPIRTVSFFKLKQDLQKFSKNVGDVRTVLETCEKFFDSKELFYLSDLDNVPKHRHIVKSPTQIDICTKEVEFIIEEFSKDGRYYPQMKMSEFMQSTQRMLLTLDNETQISCGPLVYLDRDKV